MTDKQPKTADASKLSVLGHSAFIVVVALFLFVSAKAGTRAVGIFMIISAVLQMRKGRIAYGWEGRPPSGYITGFISTVLNVVFVAIGLAMVVWPELAMGILGWAGGDNF
jgi:hypothetical protein